ncbi:MAG: bacteriohemerythrin [Magnetococcales bacterium]|nr:bacteriohemerythrin [Magnetococcales bacterium]
MVSHKELEQVELFRGMNLKVIRKGLRGSRVTELAGGQVLLSPDHDNHRLFVLLSGRLAIHFDRREPPERYIEPGGAVGESSLLERSRPSAFVIVVEPSRVLEITEEDLWSLMRLDGTAAVNLLKTLITWMKSNTGKVMAKQQKLMQSEARIRSILETAVHGIIVINEAGLIESFNLAAEKMFGYGAQEVYGKNVNLLMPSPDAENHDGYLDRYRETGVKRILGNGRELLGKRKDGTLFPIELSVSEVPLPQGRLFTGVVIDITARKEAQERLQALHNAADRFVPHRFIELLGKPDITGVALGDSIEASMTVLFSDIRGFTSLCEVMTPHEVFLFINGYLKRMEPPIQQHGGVIDKFIGDAIMALFPASPDEAVQAALAMCQEVDRYNLERIHYQKLPLRMGIGLNTGRVMLGTIGGRERMENTVIGDVVNIASRMEGLTNQYETRLLITHETRFHLQHPERFSMRLIDYLRPRGRQMPVLVYEVFDTDVDSLRHEKQITRTQFEEAVALFHLGELTAAHDLFLTCQTHGGRDPVAKIYLERIATYLKEGRLPNGGSAGRAMLWTPELAIGVENIDSQHRQIMEMASRVEAALHSRHTREVLLESMNFLMDYTLNHFSEEETLMEKWGYPAMALHRAKHRAFTVDFQRLRDEMAGSDHREAYLLFRLQSLLFDWLVNHIAREDQKIGVYLRGGASTD